MGVRCRQTIFYEGQYVDWDPRGQRDGGRLFLRQPGGLDALQLLRCTTKVNFIKIPVVEVHLSYVRQVHLDDRDLEQLDRVVHA